MRKSALVLGVVAFVGIQAAQGRGPDVAERTNVWSVEGADFGASPRVDRLRDRYDRYDGRREVYTPRYEYERRTYQARPAGADVDVDVTVPSGSVRTTPSGTR